MLQDLGDGKADSFAEPAYRRHCKDHLDVKVLGPLTHTRRLF